MQIIINACRPAPKRFNMLNFKMHCILLVLLVCLTVCEFLLYCHVNVNVNMVRFMKCSSVRCFVAAAVVATRRHSRHKLLSFRLISVVCCRHHVFWCALSTLPPLALELALTFHPFAQCHDGVRDRILLILHQNPYTRCMRMRRRQREKIYVLFKAVKCFNFFYLSLSRYSQIQNFLFRLHE